jgi:DNA-binding NarL/FixJ family response regulator
MKAEGHKNIDIAKYLDRSQNSVNKKLWELRQEEK